MSTTDVATAAADYLESHADALVSNWIDWVRERVDTETVNALPERALRNHIPPVLVSLSRYLRHPVELSRGELATNLRIHGEIRRDQGYSMAEVLAEFDGLADVVTRAVIRAIATIECSQEELLGVTNRLAAGLRSISYIAMGTFTESDLKRKQQISENLEHLARAIVHEMRNPLNSLSLGIEVLRGPDDGDTHAQQLDVMQSAIRRCRYLLDTMRILTVAESGRGAAHMVEVKDAVRLIEKEFGPSFAEHDVEFEVDRPLPELRVEALPIYIVLANIVSNAIKYRDVDKERSWVKLTAEFVEEKYDSGFCRFKISDNGVGIPDEFVPRVFQKGFRAHADVAEGTGIGLYLVQQTVMSRGGTIEIESSEGSGTTLTVTVRCLRASGDVLTADEFSVQHLMGDVVLRETLGSVPDIPTRDEVEE